MNRLAAVFLGATLLASQAGAAPLCTDLGFAGLLAKCNRGEPIELTLASGKPLASGNISLQSGAYYEMHISADGSAELAIDGAGVLPGDLDERDRDQRHRDPPDGHRQPGVRRGRRGLAVVHRDQARQLSRCESPGTTSDSQKITISIQ